MYSLTFEDRERYLFAQVRAKDMDLASAKQYLREVADQVRTGGHDRLLLERDVPTMLGPGSLYFATQAMHDHLGEDTRVAMVSVYETVLQQIDLAVLLAQNSHLQLQLFDSIGAAEAWLLRA